MMGPLDIDIFFVMLPRTITSQKPRKWCDSLEYTDLAVSTPAAGYSEFSNKAYFNKEQVYIYDNYHQRVIPKARWQNVENWAEMSKLQKEREDLIMKDFQEFINSNQDNEGDYIFSQSIGCELCPNLTFHGAGYFYFDRINFVNTFRAIIYQDTLDSVDEMNQDEGVLTLSKEYLQKQCFATLQKYRNYRNAH
ncbi:zinc-alpha-2-glycoprotein-like [Gracilinanus agilis]|uniref:zinc-alpha-2-glycoprotein-like n=1 Tax=Gracilinanus agilis TaxID=191870 RepID=UPI001CFCAA87|nr:zinc-alpha-2-glycoprotein-like [Gracilinanus agilis]